MTLRRAVRALLADRRDGLPEDTVAVLTVRPSHPGSGRVIL